MKTDVCLVLEGTYPYVSGGVSSWIHRLVTSLSDIKFSIINISSSGDTVRTPKYEVPSNILEFKEVFVHDYASKKGKTRGNKKEAWQALQRFYEGLASDDLSRFEDVYEHIIDKETRSLNAHDLMHSKRAWDMLTYLYYKYTPRISFIDFYWTMRFIHAPLMNLFDVDIPDASAFHTVCTGYAGLLGAIAKAKRNKPLILTEHGIYTHERKIEISRAKWIYSEEDKALRATRSLGFFKDAWIKKFEVLSKLTYDHADRIVTLFEGNRRMQIEAGADPAKCFIVPNGVDLPEKRADKQEDTNIVGFVGRVVSIKDVKTFIRAMKIVKESIEDAKIYIIGSGEEEPEYLEECKTLVQMLQLDGSVTFTGNVDVDEFYPLLDVMVLTSISEAQPLSVLEAMSYGIPVVASDVGACRELILGKDEQDRSRGTSGMITAAGSPHETAAAIIKILKDRELREEMSDLSVERVNKHYRTDEMMDKYREFYGSYIGK